MTRPVHSCPCPDCQRGTGSVAEHHRIAAVTGIHPETIRRGRDELAADPRDRPVDRVRLPGGGRAAPKKTRISFAT